MITDFMWNKIEDNPRIMLNELVDAIYHKFNLKLPKQTLHHHLDMLLYTLKSVKFKPETANTLENKEKRKRFVEELLAFQSQNLPILFLEETNFNIHISRSEGQSQKTTRCSTIAAASNSANIHVIGCIDNLGLIYSEVRQRLYINNLKTCDFAKKNLVSSQGKVWLMCHSCHCQCTLPLKNQISLR